MIIHPKPDASEAELDQLTRSLQGARVPDHPDRAIVTPSALKEVPAELRDLVQESFPLLNDLQLAARAYQKQTRSVTLGSVSIGGETGATVFIAGPCSVESEEQIEACAKTVSELGITILRAGCYKPRTSPYTFQGLGAEGLRLLGAMRQRYGLAIITEVRDATHFDAVAEASDIVQIGAKAMYDHGLLRGCGQLRKPVLLKRHFGATLQELAQAAEFILSAGNDQVVLCERGIRTYETGTRFTLDLCGAAWLKEKTNLPIVIDPSHAMGYAYGVADLARASAAFGVDGLLVEAHPSPTAALSDASQQLDFSQLAALHHSLPPILSAVGRSLR